MQHHIVILKQYSKWAHIADTGGMSLDRKKNIFNEKINEFKMRKQQFSESPEQGQQVSVAGQQCGGAKAGESRAELHKTYLKPGLGVAMDGFTTSW